MLVREEEPLSAFLCFGVVFLLAIQGFDRFNAVGISPTLSNPTPNTWFNTTAFTNRIGFVAGVGSYRFGTSGRNVIIGPGIVEVDSSLQKSFSVTERSHLDLRAEFFNLPNHPIFSEPGSTIGTPTA